MSEGLSSFTNEQAHFGMAGFKRGLEAMGEERLTASWADGREEDFGESGKGSGAQALLAGKV